MLTELRHLLGVIDVCRDLGDARAGLLHKVIKVDVHFVQLEEREEESLVKERGAMMGYK